MCSPTPNVGDEPGRGVPLRELTDTREPTDITDASCPTTAPTLRRSAVSDKPVQGPDDGRERTGLLTWVNLHALRDHRFSHARRGYRRSEVEAFHGSVIDLCERLHGERQAAISLLEEQQETMREHERARARAELGLRREASRAQASEAQVIQLQQHVVRLAGSVQPVLPAAARRQVRLPTPLTLPRHLPS